MNVLKITPATKPFRKTVCLPGSKSITNRALVLAALATGESTLTGVLFAEDTQQMLGALESLGYKIAVDRGNCVVRVVGQGTRVPSASAEIHCGNSGTTLRFLTAMLSLGSGRYVLDGVPRMRQRPIGQLVEQLRPLGAKIQYGAQDGYPPVVIEANGLAGGNCAFEAAQSSQYISAVLMAAPYAAGEVTVNLIGPVTSEPYLQMTLAMMEQWGYGKGAGGGRLELRNEAASRTVVVRPGHYEAREYAIEPDASNASYFLAAAALSKGSAITIDGLGKRSLQGDVGFADVLHQMGAGLVFGGDFVTVMGTGVLKGIDIDLNAMPDMVQTLAVVALFAQGRTVIRNVGNLRVKETDRLAALETELRKMGAKVETTENSISIDPRAVVQGARIATYDDHRMAMAFGVAGLRVEAGGVEIENPECVRKTYPDYFRDLAAAVG